MLDEYMYVVSYRMLFVLFGSSLNLMERALDRWVNILVRGIKL